MNHRTAYCCHVERLEARALFSIGFGAGAGETLHDAAARARISAPPTRFDLAVLHEIGHALGLGHSSDTASIMYPYYNAGYNLADFASDSAVAALRALFSSESTRPWKDALDADGGVADGDVDLTYSFVRDGARMDQGGRSDTFAALNKRFGVGNWQGIFVQELERWAEASNGTLQVRPFDADGIEDAIYNFGASGLAQNDSRMGDIRFATHRMDGAGRAGNELAHTYRPPPNGGTVAGDSHYDSAENWVLSSSSLTSSAQVNANVTSTDPAGMSLGQSTFSATPINRDNGLLLGGKSELL